MFYALPHPDADFGKLYMKLERRCYYCSCEMTALLCASCGNYFPSGNINLLYALNT